MFCVFIVWDIIMILVLDFEFISCIINIYRDFGFIFFLYVICKVIVLKVMSVF